MGVDYDTPPNTMLFERRATRRARGAYAGKRRAHASSSASSSPELDRHAKRHKPQPVPPTSLGEFLVMHAVAPVLMRLAESVLPGLSASPLAASGSGLPAAQQLAHQRQRQPGPALDRAVTYDDLCEAMLELGAAPDVPPRVRAALEEEGLPAGLVGGLSDAELIEFGIARRGDRVVVQAAIRRLRGME